MPQDGPFLGTTPVFLLHILNFRRKHGARNLPFRPVFCLKHKKDLERNLRGVPSCAYYLKTHESSSLWFETFGSIWIWLDDNEKGWD